jgi:hypothetical protein
LGSALRERPAGHLDHPAGSAVPTVNKKPMSGKTQLGRKEVHRTKASGSPTSGSGIIEREVLKEVSTMRQPLIWIAVPLLLIGAVLLVAGVGASGLWIAVITIGIALVAIDGYWRRRGHHRV